MLRNYHLKYILLLSLFSILSATLGCPSPQTRTEGGFRLVEAKACKDIKDISPGTSVPIEETDTFLTTDDQVIMWLKFENIDKPHILRWKWYAPDDILYYDTGDFTINPEGRYAKAGYADHRILIAGDKASSLPGEWKVLVFLDGNLKVTKTFKIVENET